jgi:FAD synthetase
MNRVEPKAAILVIGDEILKGQIKDTNSNFASKLLYSLGIQVCRVVVVGDDVSEIASEVRHLSSKYTFVITSGGVGPTHDDITYDAVAAAFQMELTLDEDIASIIGTHFSGPKDVSKNPAMKMAWVPQEHELIYLNGKKPKKISSIWTPEAYPVVKVRNVYVLPGLPMCFEASLQGLKNTFPTAIGRVFNDMIYLNVDEVNVVPALNATLAKFQEQQVNLGSYPVLDNPKYCTRISVETSNIKVLTEVIDYLKSVIPTRMQVDMTPVDPVKAIQKQVESMSCHRHVEQALKVSVI